MKLVWCPDTASKAYIDGVRAIANSTNNDTHDSAHGSPELAELVAAMAGGWNAQLIVDAPYIHADTTTSPSSTHTPTRRRSPPATSLALAAAARRTGGRYARLDDDAIDVNDATTHPDESITTNNSGRSVNSSTSSSAAAATAAEAAAMARLEGVDLLVLDARRHDADAVLRAARPGARGMVVVRHGDITGGGGVRRRSSAPPWGMAAGTRVVRAAYLPIGAGGVEVLHVGVGKGPSLATTTTMQQQHGHSRRTTAGGGGGGRGRWIRHVNHRTGEEHVFRRQ